LLFFAYSSLEMSPLAMPFFAPPVVPRAEPTWPRPDFSSAATVTVLELSLSVQLAVRSHSCPRRRSSCLIPSLSTTIACVLFSPCTQGQKVRWCVFNLRVRSPPFFPFRSGDEGPFFRLSACESNMFSICPVYTVIQVRFSLRFRMFLYPRCQGAFFLPREIARLTFFCSPQKK